MSMSRSSFGIIGSGRVASCLAPALAGAGGMLCDGVFSRTGAHAATLARRVDAPSFDRLAPFLDRLRERGTAILLISVSDDALPEIVRTIPEDFPITLLHTSGSVSIEELRPIESRGVLYPLQTFSEGRAVDLSRVPFFIEYSTPEAEARLREILAALGAGRVSLLSSEDRLRLHVAAVFGCNFVNHLYALSAKLLRESGVPFRDLYPLLEETLAKAGASDPKEVQTGPALRRDEGTLRKHEALLRKEDESLAVLYALLSKSIQSLSEEK